MVRAAGGRRTEVNYTEDASDEDTAPKKSRATNGSKRSYDDDDESDDEVYSGNKKPKPTAKKKKGAPPASQVEYVDASSDDVADDGELEGDDSDYEEKKSPKKPTPKKSAKKSAKKKAAAKKLASTPSRASGRASKPVRYSVDSEGEEEDDMSDEAPPPPSKKTKTTPKAKKSAPSPAGRGSGRKTKPIRYSEGGSSEEEEEQSEDEYEARQRAKGRTMPSKKRNQDHPPVSEMIPTAIKKLNENPRKGSSLAAIKGFMADEWGVNIQALKTKIKNYITNAVEDGEIIQKSGSGLSGRFTVKGMKRKVKKRRKVIKDEKEDKEEDLVEYKPTKSARDLEREKEEVEKEERRRQRKEEEIRRELERANRPKKEVPRKTEWEVEFIKAMKVVGDKTWYQVKFENFKKPSWEPEENLMGCQDVIENFLLEEKVRLAEVEEKRRREEEEGKYEVCRILEVKFPKGKPREFLIRWKGHGEELDSWEPETNLECKDLIARFMDRHEKRLEANEKSLRIAPKKVERLAFANSHRVSRRNQGFRVTYEDMDE